MGQKFVLYGEDNLGTTAATSASLNFSLSRLPISYNINKMLFVIVNEGGIGENVLVRILLDPKNMTEFREVAYTGLTSKDDFIASMATDDFDALFIPEGELQSEHYVFHHNADNNTTIVEVNPRIQVKDDIAPFIQLDFVTLDGGNLTATQAINVNVLVDAEVYP